MSILALFLLAILTNVTLVTAAALVLIGISRRWPAFRHATGVIGLGVVMASPLAVLALPRPAWLNSSSATSSPTRIGEWVPDTFDPAEAQAIAGRVRNGNFEPDAFENAPPEFEPADEPGLPPPAGDLPEGDSDVVPVTSLLPQRDNRADLPAELSPVNAAPAADPIVASAPRSALLARVAIGVGSIWCLGIVIVGWREWRRRSGLRIFMRSSSAWHSEHVGAVAQEVCLALGIKELPAVRVSEVAPLPFLIGVWRPTVILPRKLADQASNAQLRDVLVHEVAHVVRRDPPIHLMQRMAGILFWFHPGVSWLNRQIGRAREELCDNFVLRCRDAAEYAQTLLDLAESCDRQRQGLPELGLFSTRWTLEQRIGGLLDPQRDRKTRTGRGTSLVLTAILASLCLVAGGIGLLAHQAGRNMSYARPAAKTQKVAVRGKCVDDQGRPVANAVVRILEDKTRTTTTGPSETESVTFVAKTRSDQAGEFSFGEVHMTQPTPYLQEQHDFYVAATTPGRSSSLAMIGGSSYAQPAAGLEVSLPLSAAPLTVSGVVTDPKGRPVAGAHVFMSTRRGNPMPGMWSFVTDSDGRYAITDLERWQETVTETFDAEMNSTETYKELNQAAAFNAQLHVRHPDYAPQSVATVKVPNRIDLQLKPAAIIVGQVNDTVIGKPAKSVVIFAEGVVRRHIYQAATDNSGKYRLQLPQDHYNIWVDAEERIAPVLALINAIPDQPVHNADFQLVRGGFVVGTVFDTATERPIGSTADKLCYVAHYGPACLRLRSEGWIIGQPGLSIGVQQDTTLGPDGTFRLRVAPGKNHVFFLRDYGEEEQSIRTVVIEDGEEQRIRLYADVSASDQRFEQRPAPKFDDDKMQEFEERVTVLRREDKFEQNEAAVKAGKLAKNTLSPVPSRVRRDSPVNRLLDQYELKSASHSSEPDWRWKTIKALVDLGPAAVPDLIEELEATRDPWVLQLLGFTLRALDDRRAVPSLIRALPRAIPPPNDPRPMVINLNDGFWPREWPRATYCTVTDPTLFAFVRPHALLQSTDGAQNFTFGNPVEEILGALSKLTGAQNGEQELFERRDDEAVSPADLDNQRQVFQRVSENWLRWWDAHQHDPVATKVADIDESAAIEQIRRLGGNVFRDGTWVGNPVVRVQFEGNKPVSAEELEPLKRFSHLQVLSRPGNCRLTPEAIHVVCQLTSLTELHFGGNKEISGHLGELPLLTNLSTLGLVGARITNDDLKVVGQITGMKKLQLSGNTFDDEGLKGLLPLAHLTTLDLSGMTVTDSSIQVLKELRSLTSLELNWTRLTDAHLSELNQLTELVFLDLSDTKVTGVGLSALKGLRHLVRLKLNSTRVRDAGAKEIAELSSLKSLELSDTKITDDGLRELKQLKNLERLDVTETDTTAAAYAELKRALPNLQIQK